MLSLKTAMEISPLNLGERIRKEAFERAEAALSAAIVENELPILLAALRAELQAAQDAVKANLATVDALAAAERQVADLSRDLKASPPARTDRSAPALAEARGRVREIELRIAALEALPKADSEVLRMIRGEKEDK